MKLLGSHFWYNKRQRSGILFLIVIIILIQIGNISLDFSSDDRQDLNQSELIAFAKQIDSLRSLKLEKRISKIYPFNPNYITDFKAAKLGMSIAEIDRFLAFRKTGKFVNSAKEFQQITQISDSLLLGISPYFKFPDWVIERNQKVLKQNQNLLTSQKQESRQNRKIFTKPISTTDINLATVSDFQTINGISKKIAERIINYRTKLQGFSVKGQVYEVWNLDKELVAQLLIVFKTISKPIIQKINVNIATFKEVLKNPYIDYDLCKQIFDYRDQVAELQSLEELKNITDFPLEKYNRIALYLLAE